jgi:2-phosphosulfolactate phosphatase
MPDSARPSVFVHLLPALIPPCSLRGGVAVVLDVLRATTTMIHALAAGCLAVVPCLEIDEARRVAGTFPAGSALLAGEREGVPIAGFDLGNSPSAFTPGVCRGKTLVMTTTNGTRAILSCLDADRVLVGAFVNLRATVRSLSEDGRPVHIVCAGTDGLISAEDTLLAGVIATRLMDRGLILANDEAWIAWGWGSKWNPSRVEEASKVRVALLSSGRGGQRVTELGLMTDIRDAAEMDRFELVAELRRDPIRIVVSA